MVGSELVAADQGTDAGFRRGAGAGGGARCRHSSRGAASRGDGQRRPRVQRQRCGPGAQPRTVSSWRPHQFRVYLRQLRRGKEQSARQGGRDSGRGQSRKGLQPVVHLWRRRPGQDSPHACRGQQAQGTQFGSPAGVRAQRTIRQRHGQVLAAQHHQRLQDRLSLPGCVDDRRYSVFRGKRPFSGRVLPHLQRAVWKVSSK